MYKKSLATLALVAALSACQTTNNLEDLQALECSYPDTPDVQAPQWVCGSPVKGLEVSAVGYAKKSIGGLSVMNNISSTNARAELGRQFKVSAESMIKNAITSSNVTSSDAEKTEETVTELSENIEKNVSSFVLTNSRIITRKVSPNGGLYTLVGMDKKTYDENLLQLAEKTTESDPALWNKFSDQKTESSLSDALNKLLK